MTIFGPPVYQPSGLKTPLQMDYDTRSSLPPVGVPTTFRTVFQPAAVTSNPMPQIYPVNRVDKDLKSGYSMFKAPMHPCPPETPYQSGNMCFKTERAWFQ
jgi:hypothetical protein